MNKFIDKIEELRPGIKQRLEDAKNRPTEQERIEALELALLSMVLGGDNND